MRNLREKKSNIPVGTAAPHMCQPPITQAPPRPGQALAHLLPDEFLHLMDLGVVGDFVGEVSASASSLWLGSVSDSSLTDTSEPGRNREPLYTHCTQIQPRFSSSQFCSSLTHSSFGCSHHV